MIGETRSGNTTVAASADGPSSLRPDDEEAGIRHISADDLDSVFSHFDSLPFAGHRISEDSQVFDVPESSRRRIPDRLSVRRGLTRVDPEICQDSEAMSLPV